MRWFRHIVGRGLAPAVLFADIYKRDGQDRPLQVRREAKTAVPKEAAVFI